MTQYAPIEDHGIIGDLHSVALVTQHGPRGDESGAPRASRFEDLAGLAAVTFGAPSG